MWLGWISTLVLITDQKHILIALVNKHLLNSAFIINISISLIISMNLVIYSLGLQFLLDLSYFRTFLFVSHEVFLER